MLRRCYGSKAPEVANKKVRFYKNDINRPKTHRSESHIGSIFDDSGFMESLPSPRINSESLIRTIDESGDLALDNDNNVTREDSSFSDEKLKKHCLDQ